MKKVSLISLITTIILSVFTIIGFTFYNLGMCSSYSLGLYQETTMEKFLKEEDSFYCRYLTIQFDAEGIDEDNKIRNYLYSVSFIDEGNIFPYQYQKDTCYVDVLITIDDFYFRMDETFTKIALEKRDYKSNDTYYYVAVRYYSCSSEEGTKLAKLIKETFLK